jgi:hypothetical protein
MFSQLRAASEQRSKVQPTPSSQGPVGAGEHIPPRHASAPLQKNPSSHCASIVHAPGGRHPAMESQTWDGGQWAEFGTETHRSAPRSHASSVHATPSLQSRGVPATHWPEAHVSTPLQAMPSSQSESTRQVMFVRHPRVGSHVEPGGHDRSFGWCKHPATASHVSIVQSTSSLQSSGGSG